MNERVMIGGLPAWRSLGAANGVGWDPPGQPIGGSLISGEAGSVERERLARNEAQRRSRAKQRAAS